MTDGERITLREHFDERLRALDERHDARDRVLDDRHRELVRSIDKMVEANAADHESVKAELRSLRTRVVTWPALGTAVVVATAVIGVFKFA